MLQLYNGLDALGHGCLIRDVVLEVFNHTKPLDLFLSEHLGHGGVRGEHPFVLRVLQVVLLNVGPQFLDQLRPGHLRAFGSDMDIQFLRQIQGLVNASLLGPTSGWTSRHNDLSLMI